MTLLRAFALRLVTLTGILLISFSVVAQDFPSKAVRIVAAFAPGGGADLVARVLGSKLQEALGKPVIVENRPGGGGSIAVDLAAKSIPDGHTLVVSAPGALTVNMHFTTLPYDPLTDIAPVTMIARAPIVVAVNASLPVHSIDDLIAYAKARPGAVNFSTVGAYNLSFLAGELLKNMTGVNMVAVHYKGGSPGSAAIASGEVQAGFMDMAGVQPFVQSGRVRLLATAESKRLLTMPDLPTVAESGVPGYEANSWMALVAAGGTPPEILGRLSSEIARALKSPEVRERFLKAGIEPASNSPGEMSQMLRTEFEKWRTLIKLAGIKGE